MDIEKKTIEHKEYIKTNYSVFKFMSRYKICIPIIQREYIQGCDEQSIINITNEMIADILAALKYNHMINLNIIYGYSENNVFYPIDGQQRLTLLYIIIYYCALMGDRFADFISKINDFSYETKDSSKKFFETILKKAEDIRKILKKTREISTIKKNKKNNKNSESEEGIIEKIKYNLWFQVDWNNDVTINSVLSVLERLYDRISEEEAIDYYKKISDTDNPCIVCDICMVGKEGAKLNASTSYISLNARGKILENFEYIKSLLEKIEITLGNYDLFSEQYDRKYIDVFYRSVDDSKNLEEKTQEINRKSVLFLLNSYNFITCTFYNLENKNYVKDFDEFYEKIYHYSKEKEEVMKTYFKFIHKVLNELYNDVELIKEYPIIKSIWENEPVQFFEGLDTYTTAQEGLYDSECGAIFLLYIFLNNNVSKQSFKKLEYVLDNIRYKYVKQIKFEFAYYNRNKLKKNERYEYFIKVKCIDDIIKEIQWENLNEDLKCRLKEQIIKFKIVENLKMEYDYFKKYEEDESANNRQLYYLLYITELWDGDICKAKIDLLESFLKLGKCVLFSYGFFMTKWFAIATYYDDESGKLFAAGEINKRCNYTYEMVGGKKEYNLHKLDHEIYMINDSIEYGNDSKEINYKKIKKERLYTIKKVYKLLLDLNTEEKRKKWIENKFGDEYNSCWLKYAVNREHWELFDNKLKFYDEKVYTLIGYKVKGAWVRFDTRVLLLDLQEKYHAMERYISEIWSYNTEKVNSFDNEFGLCYTDLNKKIKFVGHFTNSIFNLLYIEKKLKDKNEEDTTIIRRCFFYSMDKIYIFLPEDTVYIIKDDNIFFCCFNKEYEYTIFSCSLSKYFEKFKKSEEEFDNRLNNFPKDDYNVEIDCKLWEKYYYNYLGGIYKYKKQPGVVEFIDIRSFQEIVGNKILYLKKWSDVKI